MKVKYALNVMYFFRNKTLLSQNHYFTVCVLVVINPHLSLMISSYAIGANGFSWEGAQ